MADLWTVDLGLMPYRDALELQRRVRAARIAERIPDMLLCVEHPPVYTRGRRSGPGELTMDPRWYADRGIDVVDVDRGGKITYHGPGQLVIYPICHVTDVPAFVGMLERAICAALGACGIEARGRSGEGVEYTGAWVGERKIGSVGIHVSRSVTMHGLAVNVDNDLEPFGWIVACGLPGSEMTSVARELGEKGDDRPDLKDVQERVCARLTAELGARRRQMSAAGLRRVLDDGGPPEAA